MQNKNTVSKKIPLSQIIPSQDRQSGLSALLDAAAVEVRHEFRIGCAALLHVAVRNAER